MEKLFTDAETFQKERPTKITEQQAQDFYKKVAEEIIKNQWSDSDLEDVILDVEEISVNDSGYEIAKDLERGRASYDIDTLFIEYLDGFGHHKAQILQRNVEDWVRAHNPHPKFQKGQRLVIETTLNNHQKRGDIDEHARYKKEHGKTILSKADVHAVAQNAAEHFLKLFCNEIKTPEGR